MRTVNKKDARVEMYRFFRMSFVTAGVSLAWLVTASLQAQQASPQWDTIEPELLRHFQTLLRMDTSDPPGNEQPAADYVASMLQQEGIPVQVFTREPGRPNVVARLSGDGSREPLLLMAHTDVVSVDPAKWVHPPFSATRDGGHIYGRGTLDDKDSVATALTVMLLLKRLEIPLNRDVIFLAEAGEEINTSVGIEFLVNEHYGKYILYHIDLYRLSDHAEIEALGLDEYFQGNGITVVEWPDRAPFLFSFKHLSILLEHYGESKRRIVLEGIGDRYKDFIKVVSVGK